MTYGLECFLGATHLVGWSSELPAPGDFITRQVGARAVLLCRGDDGELNAFLNVCSHEGAQVAFGCGSAKRFVCLKHGWAYDRTGTVVNQPDTAAGRAHPLRSLPVLESAGLVLLSAHEGGRPDPSTIGVPASLRWDWESGGQRNLTLTASWEAVLADVRADLGTVATGAVVSTYSLILVSEQSLLLVTAGPGLYADQAHVSLTLVVAPKTGPLPGVAGSRASEVLDGWIGRLRDTFGPS